MWFKKLIHLEHLLLREIFQPIKSLINWFSGSLKGGGSLGWVMGLYPCFLQILISRCVSSFFMVH